MNADDSFSIITIRIRVRFWTRRRCTTTATLLICLLVSLCCSLFFSLISRTDRIKVFWPHFDRALDVFPFLLLLWRHDGLQKTIPEMFVKKLEIGRKHNNVLDNTPNSRRKMCVNRSWKIPQSDHFYINQENGFCQDFVDCNGFFGLRGRLQVNKSAAILIQSRQSCCNSVQSSIVIFLHNPIQSIQSKHDWGTHRRIVPNTFTSCGRLFEPAILEPYWLCKYAFCVGIALALYLTVYFFTIGRNPENY